MMVSYQPMMKIPKIDTNIIDYLYIGENCRLNVVALTAHSSTSSQECSSFSLSMLNIGNDFFELVPISLQ